MCWSLWQKADHSSKGLRTFKISLGIVILGLLFVCFSTFGMSFRAFSGPQRALGIPFLLYLSWWLLRNPSQGRWKGKIFLLWSQNHTEDSRQILNHAALAGSGETLAVQTTFFNRFVTCRWWLALARRVALGAVPWQGGNVSNEFFFKILSLRWSRAGKLSRASRSRGRARFHWKKREITNFCEL